MSYKNTVPASVKGSLPRFNQWHHHHHRSQGRPFLSALPHPINTSSTHFPSASEAPHLSVPPLPPPLCPTLWPRRPRRGWDTLSSPGAPRAGKGCRSPRPRRSSGREFPNSPPLGAHTHRWAGGDVESEPASDPAPHPHVPYAAQHSLAPPTPLTSSGRQPCNHSGPDLKAQRHKGLALTPSEHVTWGTFLSI